MEQRNNRMTKWRENGKQPQNGGKVKKNAQKFGHVKKKQYFCRRFRGKMAEWSIASVLKTEVLKGTGGSNPSLSAE